MAAKAAKVAAIKAEKISNPETGTSSATERWFSTCEMRELPNIVFVVFLAEFLDNE